MEKYPDLLDMAQAHTERETELRIAAIQRHANAGGGNESCADCGRAIPALRRRHVPNAKRCAECQAALEKRAHPHARSAA